MNEPDTMREMLGLDRDRSSAAAPTLAVVGLSEDPSKPSHSVSSAMQALGYRILPVNPGLSHVLGEMCSPSLSDLPMRPDVVNVFRLPRAIPSIVEEMIVLGFGNLWVQLGIRNMQAAERAEHAGIRVVMDRCILIERMRLHRRS